MKSGLIRENLVSFTSGQRGCKLLVFNGFNFVRNRRSGLRTYWICAKKGSTKCNARVVTDVVSGIHKIVLESCHHNHAQVVERKKRCSLTDVKLVDRTAVVAAEAAVTTTTTPPTITATGRARRTHALPVANRKQPSNCTRVKVKDYVGAELSEFESIVEKDGIDLCALSATD